MKNILFVCVVLLFAGIVSAKETEVAAMTWEPKTYIEFIEHHFKHYWRLPDKNKEKIMQSDFGVMLKSFEHNMVHMQNLLKYSGLSGIENIKCKSYRIEKEEQKYFRNEYNIELDDKKNGFLQGLLKKLPEHKIPKIENDNGVRDLHIISNDTLFAFDMPLNFAEAFKAVPEDFVLRSKVREFAADFLDMDSDEFIDRITGQWCGIVYAASSEESQQDAGPDFLFCLPDPEQKIYKTLGEKLVVRRMAVFKDGMLNVRLLAKYKDMHLLSIENFLLIVSSPQVFLKFSNSGNEKKICENVSKLNVPEDIEYDAFTYCSSEFSAVLFSLFFGRSYPLKFMTDFGGNDSFSAVKIDDDEIEVEQYSNNSFTQMLLMPYTVNFALYADSFIYKEGKNAYVERKLADFNTECMKNMRKYAEYFKSFAKQNNNEYPQGINGKGLKILADFAKVPYSDFSSTAKDKKEIPFGRFYYWGENFSCSDGRIPLLSDRGGFHNNRIHIVFCDGSVREFEMGNVRSARRIIGFLHTVFNYDAQTFSKLMKQAEKLDIEKL